MNTRIWNASYIETLERESAAALDLAASLELAVAIRDGVSTSPLMNARQAKQLAEVTTFEIAGALKLREKALRTFEEEADRQAAAEAACRKRVTCLESIAVQLPAVWKATVEDGRIRTAIGVTLKLCNRYSRDTWRPVVTGEKIEVTGNYETRHFPRKKDGSFSIEKIIEAGRDLAAAYTKKQNEHQAEAKLLAEFKAIAQPYYDYGIYGREQIWNLTKNFTLKATAIGEGKYAVARTVVEYVDGAQLTAILEQEVGKVKKEQEA